MKEEGKKKGEGANQKGRSFELWIKNPSGNQEIQAKSCLEP
jgi:hypothetical protein